MRQHAAASPELVAKDIPIALAGVSAAIGAVVVVFVLFGLQATGHERIDQQTHSTNPHPIYKEAAALSLLVHTSSFAMVTLLFTPLFLLYNLSAAAIAPKIALAIGLGAFAFSITTLVVGLLAFFVMPPARPTSEADLAAESRLSTEGA